MMSHIACLVSCACLASAALAEGQTLFDFERIFDVRGVETRDVKINLVQSEANTALRVASGHATDWPGITLKAPAVHWDLSTRERVALDVRNCGDNDVMVCCRVDNPGGDGRKNCVTGRVKLAKRQADTLRVEFVRKPTGASAIKFIGMRGDPFGATSANGIDPANVTQLLVFVPKPKADHVFEIDNVRAEGHYEIPAAAKIDPAKFFPMIDEFGQYLHKDWPGKTHSVGDMAERQEVEEADLAKHAGPSNWTRYGGWEAGPRFNATGYFRPAKYEGKWWLVDPEGRLFWSHGADCVRDTCATTPISERKHWFRGLPKPGSPFAEFLGKGAWAPRGYYQGKWYEMYNFTAANLLRKYGQGWKQKFADITHRRLRSWGMNTIANWSSSEIYLMRRTPYVVAIHVGGPSLEGSRGIWRKFHDVFDPRFKEALRKRMAKEKDKSAGDPWCIGYFVDNELGWGSEISLSVATLTSPAGQAAKRAFIDDLKAQYGTIAKLNDGWGTDHASWDALLENREAPNAKRAHGDLTAFYTKTAETYFRICRECVKEVAPQNQYLGCRFSNVNDRCARAAAKYCDVVSYNRYRYHVENVQPPEGVDKPIIIGEFHFGALDRGMFHTGLRKVASQIERGKAYQTYVHSALANPWIVGTHWFMYGDQATTGRGDGENYQIGFLDVCDTPYVETVAACREVGYGMYECRMKSNP